MKYSKEDIDRMSLFVSGQQGYQPLDSMFYGQDGFLYFKCFKCKTWCLVDTPEQKNGATLCEVCRRVIVKFSRYGLGCEGCLYHPVDIDEEPCLSCINRKNYSSLNL